MPVLNHFITQKELFGFKIESTPYTAETLTNADYNLLVKNLKFTPTIERYKQKFDVGDFDNFADVPGKRMGEVSFDIDLRGSGTASTAPKDGKLHKACGFREEINSTFGVVYIKDSNVNAVPGTAEFVLKGSGAGPVGVKIKMRGCMGDIEFKYVKTGEPYGASVKLKGALVSVADLSVGQLPVATGWDTTTPPATLSAALKLHGYALNANTLNIKLNNKIELLTDLAQPEGYEGAYHVDGDPTFSCDPYLASDADQFFYQRATGQTGPFTGTLETWAGSTSVPGNFIRIIGGAAQIQKSHAVASREGTEMNPLEGQFVRGNTGAPMLKIIYGSDTGMPGV